MTITLKETKMDHAGIDYSLGQSNYNPQTSIHYGVISQNSINLDCAKWDYDYGEPRCPDCGSVVQASDTDGLFEGYEGELDADGTPTWFDGKDFTCLGCAECYSGDSCYVDEPCGWTYESNGYKLTDCLDTDIFVLESPYYTFAQYCSPCVPGAGNLNTPCIAKTYCLGHEWFYSNHAPYPVYQVSDNALI